jgi:BlaI family penicillinase repressor
VAKRAAPARGDLTLAQWEVLALVWEEGEVTVASAHAALSKRRKVAPTTVLTHLQRLEKRGLLVHREDGRAHVWRAARDKGLMVGSLLGRLRDLLFRGATDGLVATLLEAGPVSEAELARLRALIAGAAPARAKGKSS